MRLLIVAFALGVGLLQVQAALPSLPVLLAIGAAGGIGGWALGRRVGARWLLVAGAACVAVGFAWAGVLAQWRLAEDLPEAWEGRDIVVSGVVAALPQRFERGERFEFEVEAVHTEGAQVPGRILLSWYHGWDELGEGELAEERYARAVRPGERWRFTVRLKRPHGNANPHGFDYEAWLLERGIRATGSIRARAEAVRLADFVTHPGYAVERLRDALRERFLVALPGAPYVGVLIALAVGDQRAIPNDQWQIFNRTGITHLVSISGLHVTMIAALVAALVSRLWRCSTRLLLRLPAQRAAVLAGWLAALIYALIAGFEVPAQRTLYMLSVVAWCLWAGRHYGVARTLLMALLVVLVLDPWAVLATGFWLSFGAVGVLFFVASGRGESAERAAREASVLSEGWRQRWSRALLGWGLAQWAVTLGSVPLLLFFFQQFSLVSPLANALAIPLVSFVITPLALLFALFPWPPLVHLAHALLAWMMDGLQWLAALPVWLQPAPPLWSVLLALLGVFWLLLPRGFPARWVGLVLLLPALFSPPPRPAAGEAWVEVLDVGQGLAVVVRTRQANLLYDTGPLYGPQANAGQRVVVPYLRALGVRELDVLVVSHRDKDHAGGTDAVRAALPVRRALSSMTEPGFEPCIAGQSWAWDGVRFSLLHPDAAAYAGKPRSTNALSCVLRIESQNGTSMLLTGDIEASNERALIARARGGERRDAGSELRADVLLVPHHGGRGSSSVEFIAAVAPRHAVFSAGYRNAFGHPRTDILARYAGSHHWRTDRDGALRIVLTDTASVRAWRQERARYWHAR